MKKFFTITLAAFAAASSFVSCDKEIEAPDTSENNAIETPVAGKMITITATLSDALTKVSFDPSFDSGSKPTGMSHTWEDGDKLRITDASNISNTKVFDLVSGAGTNSGTFSGEAIEASSYTVEVIPCGDYSEGNLQTQVKDGSTSHLKFVASATGVTDLSNINLSETSKIIGFIAKMPSGVSATINMLTIETSTDDFLTKTSLVVSLTNQEDVDTDGILKVYANVPASWSIPANTKMLLRFGSTNASHTVYTRYQEFASAVTINAGEFNYIKMNCSNIGQFAGKEDDGTAAHPYLIADGYQLQALNSLLGAKDAGTTVYSELVDNIDLSVYTNWTSIDASTRFINLEGNGKTISNLKQTSGSYPGLFYILYGTVKNFTISKANVSGGSGSAGILAGYLCSNTGASIGCTIDNVTIKESSLNGNGKVCGAIAGSVGQHASNTFAINISNVTVSGTTVETTNDCGGLIALTQGQTSTNRSLSISDCEIINSTVSSTGTGIRVGGVVGYARSLNTTISDIDVKGTNVSGLSKAKAVGGIVGLVESGVDFDKCTYEKNGTTTATVTGPTKHNNETDNASNDSDATLPGGAYVGGIAGEVSGSASFDDCHVKNATVTVTTPASNTGYWKNLGGAFGYVHNNNATIGATTACSVESTTVTGYHFAGGFVGFFDGGTISGAEVTGLSFSGWNYSGGFVGQMKSGLIEDSSVAGTSVTSANATVGGFAGRILGGTLDGNSTSLQVGTSSKKMTTNIGGFAGTIEGGALEDCHATGSVFASGNYDGGFVGSGLGGSFTDCSATGAVTGNTYVGGFVGQAQGETFTGCSYEGTSLTATGSNKNGFLGGFCGRALTTASSFTNCHVGGSSAVTISSTGAQRCGGFIGQLDGLSPATSFSKCYVKNVNISGPANTGGFVGVQYGPIENCWVEGGSVTSVAGGNTGGFSAFVQNSGATANLTNCYTTANVNGASYNTVGGFIGIANNSVYTVQYCYSTGTVSGSGSNIGGFVGNLSGSNITVDKCISWNSSLALYGADGGATLTDNYVKGSSETGTVSSHAQESPRSWDSAVWDFTTDLPTLK